MCEGTSYTLHATNEMKCSPLSFLSSFMCKFSILFHPLPLSLGFAVALYLLLLLLLIELRACALKSFSVCSCAYACCETVVSFQRVANTRQLWMNAITHVVARLKWETAQFRRIPNTYYSGARRIKITAAAAPTKKIVIKFTASQQQQH